MAESSSVRYRGGRAKQTPLQEEKGEASTNGTSKGEIIPKAQDTASLVSTQQNGSSNDNIINLSFLGVVLFFIVNIFMYQVVVPVKNQSKLPVVLRARFIRLFPVSLWPVDHSMGDGVGDKTRRYRDLRADYDAILPRNDDRTRSFVESIRKNWTHEYYYASAGDDGSYYDVTNCPSRPPKDYPHAWPVMDVISNWKTDDTVSRPKLVYQGLCVFDYATDFEKVRTYREQELPFVIRNDPAVLRTVERWNHPSGYLHKLLGDTPYETEKSTNGRFLYWRTPNTEKKQKATPEGWKPPTERLRLSYDEWLTHANVSDAVGPDSPHWYFRLIGCGLYQDCHEEESVEYLFDELPFFQPREDSFYVVEPKRQQGIHCRFGMKGVIAENHFDGARNMIALLGGERRYILSHPDQCPSLALFPKGHPSARHSAVDWSNPDLEAFPQFQNALVNEVVLRAGEVLYLPTNWFHYIVSLELNFQCNTRSGKARLEYIRAIKNCGF